MTPLADAVRVLLGREMPECLFTPAHRAAARRNLGAFIEEVRHPSPEVSPASITHAR